LLTFDYGLDAAELFQPQRAGGTLRAYYRHQWNDDLLARAGEQDLTAQVDFTGLERAGASAGLQTERLGSQAQFLTAVAAATWEPDSDFGEWPGGRTRQFQTLTHPEHLGRGHRVLIQRR
jgi:SAM-dependent MidA family methyltransferase